MANKQRKKRLARGRRRVQTPGVSLVRSEGSGGVGEQIHRRDLTVRTYTLRTETLDKETRSIEAVLATENRVLVFDMRRWEVVEEVLLMSGARFGEQVVYIDTHDRTTIEKILGSTRQMRVEGDKLIGRNYYATTEEGERAFQLVGEGHLTDNSIGYRINGHTAVVIDEGKTVEVAGRTFTASPTRPLRVVTEWEVRENSACPIGADMASKNRQLTDDDPNNLRGHTMNFEKWLQERGFSFEELDETQRANMQKIYDAEQGKAAEPPADPGAGARSGAANDPPTDPPPADPPDPAEAARVVVKAERQRCLLIRAEAGDDVSAETVQRMIDEGKTVDEARTVFLAEIRGNRPNGVGTPGIISRDSSVNDTLLVDAMMLRAGFEDTLVAEAEGQKRAEMADRLRSMVLVDICRHALSLAGQSVPLGREEMIRAAFSTNALSNVLGALANKSMLKGYNSVEETWQKWCSTGSASDYKPQNMTRLVDTLSLDQVGEGGEVTSGQIGDEKEAISVARYAKKFGVDDMTIINDDLNALTEVPMMFGRAARELIGDLVYRHLLANGNMSDSVPLFHATHLNLNTGKTFTSDNVKNAITVFKQQKIKKGVKQRRIRVKPVYLLIPPELEWAADIILNSGLVVVAGDTDLVRGDRNVLQNKLEPIVESRLSDTTFSGYSATSWYVTGGKNSGGNIKVNFLMGRQMPVLEKLPAGVDHFGIFWRVRHDAGAKAADSRTMQKNTA